MEIVEKARGLPAAVAQGAEEATGGAAGMVRPEIPALPNLPNPELAESRGKPIFSTAYKMRIVAEADICTTPGEVGALLRRHSLYDSYLHHWRKKQREGTLDALAAEKPGPRPDRVFRTGMAPWSWPTVSTAPARVWTHGVSCGRWQSPRPQTKCDGRRYYSAT